MKDNYNITITYDDVSNMVKSMLSKDFGNKETLIEYLTYHFTNTELEKISVDEVGQIFLGRELNYVSNDIRKLQQLIHDPSTHLLLRHRFNFWDYDEDLTNETYGVFKNPEDTSEDTYYLNCDIVETFRFSKTKPLLVEEYYCDEQNNTKSRAERVGLDMLHVISDGVFYTAEEYLKSIS